MKTRLISLLIAAALSSSAAQAAEPAKAPAAPTAEQQATRAEIDKLVQRIQVLSSQLGDGSDVRVIVRRGGMGPGMPGHEGMDHDMMMGDGPMQDMRIERRGGPDMMRSGPGLGIVMAPNPAAAGVRIAAVTPDSPAQKAGLRTNDVILSINGKTVSGSGTGAVDQARDALGELKKDQVVKLRYAREGKTFDASVKAGDIKRVMMFNRDGGDMPRMHDGDMHQRMMMLPPGVEMEIERVGPRGECPKGEKDCGLPNLFQAFRWQGLNLSSVDAGLGRYFGTDKGVLVLSSGPDLKGLQSGDVIQRVAGAAVESPRDVMRALRDKDAGSQLQMDVLRDRKVASVSVTVPESRPLPFMEAPPPPPAPPAPPASPGAPRPPRPAPPAPPPPPAD